jgi:hypothetical protein
MGIQPNNFRFIVQPQSATAGSPNIDNSLAAGSTFDGQGNDFLDPNQVLDNVNDFSIGIGPVTSNTLTSLLVPSDPFTRNDQSENILSGTNSLISSILSPGFGKNLQLTVPVISLPSGGSIPDFGVNPDPTKITLFTDFFAQSIQPQTNLPDTRNFDPTQWRNPNPTNILLGSLQAQSSILGGSFQFPPFNPFPTQAVTQFPSNPFPSQTGTQIPVNLFQGQAQLPITSPFAYTTAPQQQVPVAVPVPVPVPVGIPMMPVMQTPAPVGYGMLNPGFPVYAQACPPPTPSQSFPMNRLLSFMNSTTTFMSRSLRYLTRNNAATAGSAGSIYPDD